MASKGPFSSGLYFQKSDIYFVHFDTHGVELIERFGINIKQLRKYFKSMYMKCPRSLCKLVMMRNRKYKLFDSICLVELNPYAG